MITVPDKMPKHILNKKLSIGFDPKLFTKKTIDILFRNNNCRFKALKKKSNG